MTTNIGEGSITVNFEAGKSLTDLLNEDAQGIDAFIQRITSQVQAAREQLINFAGGAGLEPQEIQRFTDQITQAQEIIKLNAAEIGSAFALSQHDVALLAGELADLVAVYNQTALAADSLGVSQDEAFAAIDAAVDDYQQLKKEAAETEAVYQTLQVTTLSLRDAMRLLADEREPIIDASEVDRGQVAIQGFSDAMEAAGSSGLAQQAVLQDTADAMNELRAATKSEADVLRDQTQVTAEAQFAAGQLAEAKADQRDAALENVHTLRLEGNALFELEVAQERVHATSIQLDSAIDKSVGTLAQSEVATEDLGNAQIRGSVTAERMRFGIINLAKGLASGRGEFALFNFVTQEVTNSMITAGRTAQQTGAGGFQTFKNAIKGLGTSFAALAGPQAIVIGAIAIGTIAYTKWRQAVDKAKKSQEAWARALITGGKTARQFAVELTQNLIIAGSLQKAFEDGTISIAEFVTAIAGGREGVDVLDELIERQKELSKEKKVTNFLDAFATTRDTDERPDRAKEFLANEKLIKQIEDEAGSREIANARRAQAARLLEDETDRARESGTASEQVRLNLIGETEARENLQASITGTSAIIGELSGANLGLRNSLERVANQFDDTDVDGFTRRLLDLVETERLEGVTLDQVNTILGALETARAEEAAAAEQAAADKQAAQEESLAREQAELEVIEEKIAARLAEGNAGLSAIRAVQSVSDAEEALVEAQTRKLEEGETRIQAVESAALDLVESLQTAVALAEELPEGIFEELLGRLDEFAEVGLIDESTIEAIVGTIEGQSEAWETIDTLAQTFHENALTGQQLLRESIMLGTASLDDIELGLLTLADLSIGVDVDILADFDRRMEAVMAGTLNPPSITVTVRPRVLPLPSSVFDDGPGFAHGGVIRPGQVGIVGEEGPEFAFPTKQGTLILPNSASVTTFDSSRILNQTTTGPTNEVTINLQGTDDDKENVVTALLLVGLNT